MKLHVDGAFIKDEINNIVVLKGVNIADPQHLNTKPQERPGVSAISVATLAIETYNAKVIRIPVLPGSSPTSPDGWFSNLNGYDKYFNQHLDPLVKFITSKKIYCIIDFHYVADYLDKADKVTSFWNYIAPKYKDNPYVIYEIFNEPVLPDDWVKWADYIARPTVNLIRQFAPENLIIVGGPYWSSHMAGAALHPIQSNNIVYTAHIYPNQTSDKWAQNYGPLLGKYPIFVTEWGYDNSALDNTTKGTTSGFAVPLNTWMDKYSFSRTAWIFDCLWPPSMFDRNWNLKSGENYMGEFVKNSLKYVTPNPTPPPIPNPTQSTPQKFYTVFQVYPADKNERINVVTKGYYKTFESAQNYIATQTVVESSTFGIEVVILA